MFTVKNTTKRYELQTSNVMAGPGGGISLRIAPDSPEQASALRQAGFGDPDGSPGHPGGLSRVLGNEIVVLSFAGGVRSR
jgi:hypothetical protein